MSDGRNNMGMMRTIDKDTVVFTAVFLLLVILGIVL